ncbi:MAG: HEPN domain-containing protein [Actinobacteria bacterium]|nr:HEPN domain-containing protein [Actinomycetota bacterium]
MTEDPWDQEAQRDAWLEQAGMALGAAEEMMLGGLHEEAITNSFLAMLYAARAALSGRHEEIAGWDDVVERFREAALSMGLSPGNRRALVIVRDLYYRVAVSGEMEADPLTTSACLNDARAFLLEISRVLETGGGGSHRGGRE